MTFSKNTTVLGELRVLNARQTDEGVGVVSKSDTALVFRLLPKNSATLPKASKVVSYADECFILERGKMHKRGEFEYEGN